MLQKSVLRLLGVGARTEGRRGCLALRKALLPRDNSRCFIEHLICASHWAKCLTHINSLTLPMTL